MKGLLKSFTLIVLVLAVSVIKLSAQITVNNTAPYNDPIWLVNNVLVDSNQVILPAYNPPFSGIQLNQPASTQIGYFDANGTNFPLKSGIVLATAGIDVARPGAAYNNPNTARPDADLDGVLSSLGLTAQTLFDKSVIEFSFTAVSDSIKFEYIFASNEYSNYTCTGFNDVFGFFLSGSGINGNPNMSTVNVARIPNTNVPVAINTVNGGAPTGGGQASNCLSANPNYVAHSVYFNNNPSLNAVNFNGYTRVFQAEAEVVCGNTYHIKLAITDVVDGALNSAVFLKENSFKSPTYKFTPIPNANNSFVDTALVEGCSVTPLILEKQGSFLGKNVATTIKTSGTAIEGVDYLQITDSIFMPAGKRFDTIYIQGINDAITEGVETIVLDFEQVMTGCSFSLKGSHTLYLRDKTPLQASIAIGSATDTIKCPTDSILLTVTTSGGDGISFLGWFDDPTITSPNRYVSPPNDTTYYFYFTDECNTDTIIDSIRIYTLLNDPLELAEQEYVVCDGDRIVVEPEITGGSPPYVIKWFNGSNLSTVEVEPISDTNWLAYSVTDFCGVQLFDSILVARDTGIKPNFESEIDFGDPLTVSFLSDPSLRISYLWDFGDGNISTEKDPVHTFDDPGQYNVTLTVLTPDSCIKQVSRIIEVEEIYELYIPNAFTPNGDSKNDFFTIQGTGIENYEIMIFNRWGKLVFQSNDIENAWDGRLNGTSVQTGVYSYRISVTTTFGGQRERRGTLTLYN